jgi:hypothetical protein
VKRFRALSRRLCMLLACLLSSTPLCLAQDVITTFAGNGTPTQLNYPRCNKPSIFLKEEFENPRCIRSRV